MTKSKKAKAVTFVAMNSETLTSRIRSITRRGKALRKFIHETAVGFSLHYVNHGDLSKAMELANAIGASVTKSARTAFIEWVIQYTHGLRWNEKDGVIENDKTVKKDDRRFDPEGFTVTLFDMERPPKPMVFSTGVASYVTRVVNAWNRNVTDGAKNEVTEAQARGAIAYGKSQGMDVSGITLHTMNDDQATRAKEKRVAKAKEPATMK